MKKVYSHSCYSGYPTEYNDQHNESIKPLHVHITDTGRKRRKHITCILSITLLQLQKACNLKLHFPVVYFLKKCKHLIKLLYGM